MKTKLAGAALLLLVLPSLNSAEQPAAKYTTLIVEFVGEMDKPVPTIVISATLEEGEWYKQHLVPKFSRFFTHVEVVPVSVVDEITELPLLKRALESAKLSDEEPKTSNNVRFTAGVGHHHAQIMVDDQTSTKILKDVATVVAKYPTLTNELQEVEGHVEPRELYH
jgi:hypothetical protein